MTDSASAQRCCNSPAPHWIFNISVLLTDAVSSLQQIQPVVARGSLVTGVPCGVGRDDESGRAYSKRGPFHEVFNLSENERPLPGRSANALACIAYSCGR